MRLLEHIWPWPLGSLFGSSPWWPEWMERLWRLSISCVLRSLSGFTLWVKVFDRGHDFTQQLRGRTSKLSWDAATSTFIRRNAENLHWKDQMYWHLHVYSLQTMVKHYCCTYKYYCTVAHLPLIFQVIIFVCAMLECFFLVRPSLSLSLSSFTKKKKRKKKNTSSSSSSFCSYSLSLSPPLSPPTTSFSPLLFPVDKCGRKNYLNKSYVWLAVYSLIYLHTQRINSTSKMEKSAGG